MSDSVESAPGGSEGQNDVPTSTGSSAGQRAVEAAHSLADRGERQEAARERRKVVVEGQEQELDIDEIIKGYQKASASNKKFMEAAKKEREVEERWSKFKSDPIQTMLESGLSAEDLETHMAKYLRSQMEQESKSPEQKAFEQRERELAEREAKLKKFEEQERSRAEQAEVEHWQADYNRQFIAAMESGRLPKTAHAGRRVAEILRSSLEAGHDISVDDAIDIFNEDHNAYLMSSIKAMDPSQVEALLGEDFIKKVRKSDIDRITNPTPKSAKQPKAPEPKQEKRLSAEEFFKNLDKKHGKYHFT